MPGGFRTCLALLVISALVAQPARAQEPPRVSLGRNQAVVDFPETVTFYLEAEGPAAMERAEIGYGVERQACPADGGCTVPRASLILPHLASPGRWCYTMGTLQLGICGPGLRKQQASTDSIGHITETTWRTLAIDGRLGVSAVRHSA
jgi:hypothetical protein